MAIQPKFIKINFLNGIQRELAGESEQKLDYGTLELGYMTIHDALGACVFKEPLKEIKSVIQGTPQRKFVVYQSPATVQ